MCIRDRDGHNHSGNIHVHIVIGSVRTREVERKPYMQNPRDWREGCLLYTSRCVKETGNEVTVGPTCSDSFILRLAGRWYYKRFCLESVSYTHLKTGSRVFSCCWASIIKSISCSMISSLKITLMAVDVYKRQALSVLASRGKPYSRAASGRNL